MRNDIYVPNEAYRVLRELWTSNIDASYYHRAQLQINLMRSHNSHKFYVAKQSAPTVADGSDRLLDLHFEIYTHHKYDNWPCLKYPEEIYDFECVYVVVGNEVITINNPTIAEYGAAPKTLSQANAASISTHTSHRYYITSQTDASINILLLDTSFEIGERCFPVFIQDFLAKAYAEASRFPDPTEHW